MFAVAGAAIRLIVCCAIAAPLPSSAAAAAIPAWNAALFFLLSIWVLLILHRLVDDEFARIDEHHHEHSAGEDVVGRDLALFVRVPHERPATLVGGIGLGVAG